jgi:hypothetical protein
MPCAARLMLTVPLDSTQDVSGTRLLDSCEGKGQKWKGHAGWRAGLDAFAFDNMPRRYRVRLLHRFVITPAIAGFPLDWGRSFQHATLSAASRVGPESAEAESSPTIAMPILTHTHTHTQHHPAMQPLHFPRPHYAPLCTASLYQFNAFISVYLTSSVWP